MHVELAQSTATLRNRYSCHQEGYSEEDSGGGVLRIGGIAIRTGGDGGIRHVKRKQARRAAHPPELGSPGEHPPSLCPEASHPGVTLRCCVSSFPGQVIAGQAKEGCQSLAPRSVCCRTSSWARAEGGVTLESGAWGEHSASSTDGEESGLADFVANLAANHGSDEVSSRRPPQNSNTSVCIMLMTFVAQAPQPRPGLAEQRLVAAGGCCWWHVCPIAGDAHESELAAFAMATILHLQEYDGLEDAMQRFARTDIGGGAAPEDARGELGCAHPEQQLLFWSQPPPRLQQETTQCNNGQTACT
jgi:hypothetical protein